MAVNQRSRSVMERCGFFDTGPQFVTILTRQRDHANDRDQIDRANRFTDLLNNLDKPD